MSIGALAFVGGGNMARALIAGVVARLSPRPSLRVIEPDAARAAELARDFPVAVLPLAAALDGADLIVLAVKPQVVAEVLPLIAVHAGPQAQVLSIAAGIPLARLGSALGSRPLVRAMPNTPAMVGAAITAMYAAPDLADEQRVVAESLVGSVGDYLWLADEAQMDAVTALSGSGPAYFFLLTEALEEAGMSQGLPAQTAAQLARATAVGSAALLAADRATAAEQRARVTSPGGTTAAAIAQLEQAGLRSILADAVAAAVARGRALARS